MATVHRISRRIFERLPDIGYRKMEIATAVNARESGMNLSEFEVTRIDQRRVERECRVGVRRGDDVGGVVFGGGTQDRNGIFERTRAVVKAVQDMRMDINQKLSI